MAIYTVLPTCSCLLGIVAKGGIEEKNWWEWLHYSVGGNALWRFGLLLLVILATLVAGRIVRYFLNRTANKLSEKEDKKLGELFLRSLAGPLGAAVFGAGMYLGRLCLRFDLGGQEKGFSEQVFNLWGQICQAIIALAGAYFIYRLVDIIEYYLKRWTSRTQSKLDDMLVPMIRKSLRIFIVVVGVLFIADNILGMDIGAILATAGIGGLAFALAAKDTVANFFGSVTIFADRPFQVGERIRIGGFDGPVEEVGIRSTRIRTLDGHLVSVPNNMIANEMLENIGRRPYIKRIANIGVTYDTPPEKVEKAVQMIKEILAGIEEVSSDSELEPKVYFSEFKDYYLNILMIYWFKPPNYWDYQQTNEKINLAIMRAFEAEGIEFAFPTQTLHINKAE